MAKCNVKVGDAVVVISGKDAGKQGKVLKVLPADNKVVVAGVNLVSKTHKARSAQDKSEIRKQEGAINVSNVMLVCPKCGKATRVHHAVVDGKKVRVCKCGASLDGAAKVEKKADKKVAKVEEAQPAAEEKPAPKAAKAPAKKTTKSAATKVKATKAATTKKATTTAKSSQRGV